MTAYHHLSDSPGAHHNTPAKCLAHAESTDFKVLHRAPQLDGDPEFAVCAGNNCVALFFNEDDAKLYARWRKLRCPKNLTTLK